MAREDPSARREMRPSRVERLTEDDLRQAERESPDANIPPDSAASDLQPNIM